MSNIKIIEGKFFEIAETIKNDSVNYIFIHNPDNKEFNSELKEVTKRILKNGGACISYGDDYLEIENLVKERTTKDDTILSFGNDFNIINACRKLNRNLVYITEDANKINEELEKIEKPIEIVEENKGPETIIGMNENTKFLFDDIIKSCGNDNFTIETNSSFSKKLKVSLKTIGRCIKYLKENNYVSIERYGQGRKIILISEKRQDTRQDNNKVSQVRDNSELSTGQDEEQEINVEAEFLLLEKELALIPENQVIELQKICREHNLIVDDHYLELKIQIYKKFRNYDQIKAILLNFFQEISEQDKSTLNQYLSLHCIDRPVLYKYGEK